MGVGVDYQVGGVTTGDLSLHGEGGFGRVEEDFAGLFSSSLKTHVLFKVNS